MNGVKFLQGLDKRQLFRLFVDGRYHRRSNYHGWIGYEAKEAGSVQAMINAFSYMMDNLSNPGVINTAYLLELHRIALSGVTLSSDLFKAGEIRCTNIGKTLYKRTTTAESLAELINFRLGDGSAVFNDREFEGFTAEQVTAEDAYWLLQENGKLNYRGWLPDKVEQVDSAVVGGFALHELSAKHAVQIQVVSKMEKIVENYNRDIRLARDEEEVLVCIALLVRQLAALRPFDDGNRRVISGVLLAHLLMSNGFPPACLYNLRFDLEYSLEQWVLEIKNGIEQTEVLLGDPDAEVYGYSVSDMPVQYQQQFSEMSAELVKKIDNYREIFLTPKNLSRYVDGEWTYLDNGTRYTGVSTGDEVGAGHLYFATSVGSWLAEGENVAERFSALVASGVRAIVTDSLQYVRGLDVPVLLVSDVEKAFADAAFYVRQEVNPKTVLITGTDGKTSSKVQLYSLLKPQGNTQAFLDEENTGSSTFKSLVTMSEDLELVLNEFSVGSEEEQTIYRSKIMDPDICFFSHISADDVQNHGSLDEVIAHQAASVEGLRNDGYAIVNSHMDSYIPFAAELNRRRSDINVMTFGIRSSDDARLLTKEFDSDRLGWKIHASILGEDVLYFTPLFQTHSPVASVGILLTAKLLGIDLEQAALDFEKITPHALTGQIYNVQNEQGSFLLYDQSRRASISSVRSVFKDLKNFNIKGKKIALYGSIATEEDDEWAKSYHEELAKLINTNGIQILLTTGPNMGYLHHKLKSPDTLVLHSDDSDELYSKLKELIAPGDLLLIQGYQKEKLGNIVNRLRGKPIDHSTESIDSDGALWSDVEIKALGLSGDQVDQYKGMLIADEIAKGVSAEALLTKYSVKSVEDLNSIEGKYADISQVRSSIMREYFYGLDLLLADKYGFSNIDRVVRNSGYKQGVTNERYCTRWFNNLYDDTNEPKKQLFGSFYDIGHESLVLHFMAGTRNLHVGFVRYQKSDGQITFVPVVKGDELLTQINDALPEGLVLKHRKWAYKWMSIDLGSFIDLSVPAEFQMMVDFESSDVFRSVVSPVIEAVLSKMK